MQSRHEEVVVSQTLTVRCRLFARYAEIAGTPDLTLQLPVHSTVGDAVAWLRSHLAGGQGLPPRPMAAVNAVHARLEDEVHDGDEIALLPPLAGGVA